jgi:hypothetical protein
MTVIARRAAKYGCHDDAKNPNVAAARKRAFVAHSVIFQKMLASL